MSRGAEVSVPSKELAALQRRRIRPVRLVLFGIVILLASSMMVSGIRGTFVDRDGLQRARQGLEVGSAPWIRTLINQQSEYRLWLLQRGTSFEVAAFDWFTQRLFLLAQGIGSFTGGSRAGSLFEGLTGAVVVGLFRLLFFLCAGLRLWLAVSLIAAAIGFTSFKMYRGRDLLGETGNNRLFYSGIRAGIAGRLTDAIPNFQVTGLACPRIAPPEVTRSSLLYRVLERYGALTTTTQQLVAIIAAHPEWPMYVASADERATLARVFPGAPLVEMSSYVLERALLLHIHYADPARRLLPPAFFEEESGRQEPLTPRAVVTEVHQALHRVLLPEHREALATLPLTAIATVVLAVEAGKTMAFSEEAGTWMRVSAFPQLSARSVLHSLPSFSDEFDVHIRAKIRRALVFGNRQSVFAPVQFPVDFSPDAFALRQWVEVLLAAPHTIASIADEVELTGMVRSLHQRFEQRFFELSAEETRNQGISSPSNLFFLPVALLTQLYKETSSDSERARLDELVRLVSQRQRMAEMAEEFRGETRHHQLHSFERVFAPLSPPQIELLASRHETSVDAMRMWSSLRVVLNSFGWLGRRVGDFSVPESSVILAASRVDEGVPDANSHGFIGRRGLVPLRGSKIFDRWGADWRDRFAAVRYVTMAETEEEFSRRLRGERELREITSEGEPLTPSVG